MRGWVGRVWWDDLTAWFREECANCERYFLGRVVSGGWSISLIPLSFAMDLAFGCVALGWEQYCYYASRHCYLALVE